MPVLPPSDDAVYYHDFTLNGVNYKLCYHCGKSTALTLDGDNVPTMVELPKFVVKGIMTKFSFEDNLAHGLEQAHTMEITLDLSSLYNDGTTNWTVLRGWIVTNLGDTVTITDNEYSETIYTRNRWILFSDRGEGVTDVKDMYIVADCLQDVRPSRSYKIAKNEATEFKLTATDIVSTVWDYIPKEIDNTLLETLRREGKIEYLNYSYDDVNYRTYYQGQLYLEEIGDFFNYRQTLANKLYQLFTRTDRVIEGFALNPLRNWQFYLYPADQDLTHTALSLIDENDLRLQHGVKITDSSKVEIENGAKKEHTGLLKDGISGDRYRDVLKILCDNFLLKCKISQNKTKGFYQNKVIDTYSPLEGIESVTHLDYSNTWDVEVEQGGNWIAQSKVKNKLDAEEIEIDGVKYKLPTEIIYKGNLGNISDDQDEVELYITNQIPCQSSGMRYKFEQSAPQMLLYQVSDGYYRIPSPYITLDLGQGLEAEYDTELDYMNLPAYYQDYIESAGNSMATIYTQALATWINNASQYGFIGYIRAKGAILLYGNYNQCIVKCKTDVNVIDPYKLGSIANFPINTNYDDIDFGVNEDMIITSIETDYNTGEVGLTLFAPVI